jgi:hypothetical protein
MNIDGNAAAVVRYCDTAVLVDRNCNDLAEAADGFVNRVVHDFVDEVMQSLGTRSPNVHCWTFSNWIEAFEDLD